jgi:anti-sigma factor RsiW
MTPMVCNRIQERLSDYLDGAVSGQEMQEIARHIDGDSGAAGCNTCAGELAAWRMTQNALVAVGPAKAPAELALTLRLAISHEKARRESRLLDRLSLAWDNGLRPALLQVSAGLASSVVLLGSILTLMNMVGVAPTVQADDEPLGAMTQPHYLYSTVGSDAVVTPTDSPIVVEAAVDTTGRVYDYRIVAGPQDAAVRTQVVNQLLDSVFEPASAFGVPIRGRVILTYSGILVRG